MRSLLRVAAGACAAAALVDGVGITLNAPALGTCDPITGAVTGMPAGTVYSDFKVGGESIERRLSEWLPVAPKHHSHFPILTFSFLRRLAQVVVFVSGATNANGDIMWWDKTHVKYLLDDQATAAIQQNQGVPINTDYRCVF